MRLKRRPLRYVITSALLVGPALGCGGNETEPTQTGETTQAQTAVPEEDPTGNPGEPEPEPEPEQVPMPLEEPPRTNERPEGVPSMEPVVAPPEEPRPRINTRRPLREPAPATANGED